MLHGFTQNPTLFQAKTRALHKHLSKNFPHHSIHFSYPRAPHKLAPASIPNFRAEELDASAAKGEDSDSLGWWRRKDYDERSVGIGAGMVYEGLEAGLEVIAG
ncbi:MAG: hypothetical protein Q9217_006660, partial [Psora testacea]